MEKSYDIEKQIGVKCAVDGCPYYYGHSDDNNCRLNIDGCEDYIPRYRTNHFGEMMV